MTDPTTAEIVRRLDDLVRRVEGLYQTLERSYVRRDVYDAKHEALRRDMRTGDSDLREDIKDLQQSNRDQNAFRRQVMAGVAVGVIMAIFSLLVSLAMFTVGLGGTAP